MRYLLQLKNRMKYLYTLVALCLFSSCSFLSSNKENNFGIEGKAEWMFERLKDPMTNEIPAGIRKREIVFAENLESKPITTAFSEGANFFTLSSSKQKSTYCELKAIEIMNKATPKLIQEKLLEFLKCNGLLVSNIDAILLGNNGDSFDNYYHNLQNSIFNTIPQIHYKHLSGEYFIASAFGFWAATNIIKQQKVPKALLLNKAEKSNYKNVLLYNQFKGQQHSFILLSSC